MKRNYQKTLTDLTKCQAALVNARWSIEKLLSERTVISPERTRSHQVHLEQITDLLDRAQSEKQTGSSWPTNKGI